MNRILDQEFLCASHSLFFEQKGLQKFYHDCPTKIHWVYGGKITCLKGSAFQMERNSTQKAGFKDVQNLVSSLPGSDLDGLNVEAETTLSKISQRSWWRWVYFGVRRIQIIYDQRETVVVLRAICKFTDISFIKWWFLISFLLNIDCFYWLALEKHWIS